MEALDVAVDEFAAEMKVKLARKAMEGYSGWDDEQSLEEIERRLKEHFERYQKGDRFQFVDIANLCMMAHRLYKHVPQTVGEIAREELNRG